MPTFQSKLEKMYETTRNNAKKIQKNNKRTVVTASNAHSLSLKNNSIQKFEQQVKQSLTPNQFCAYQRQKSNSSDIFNMHSTSNISTPIYALAETFL